MSAALLSPIVTRDPSGRVPFTVRLMLVSTGRVLPPVVSSRMVELGGRLKLMVTGN